MILFYCLGLFRFRKPTHTLPQRFAADDLRIQHNHIRHFVKGLHFVPLAVEAQPIFIPGSAAVAGGDGVSRIVIGIDLYAQHHCR